MPSPKRLLFLVGTRPEVIKMAPVILEARARSDRFDPVVCFTGQHREMAPQIASFFGIEPDLQLDVMRPDQNLSGLTARLLDEVATVVRDLMPEALLVQGDTTTVLAGALTGYYERVPIVGHVEAGLRTEDKFHPYPEEMNRRLAGCLADLHFAPTEGAAAALRREAVPEERIHVTGNTVIDALNLSMRKLIDKGWPMESLKERLPAPVLVHVAENAQTAGEGWKLRESPIHQTPLVLITGHRRENFGEGFQQICRALRRLAEGFSETDFIYPVHLNPRVQEPVHESLGGLPNLHLIEPVDYPDFVTLMAAASLIITDSGGVQEEAPALGRPVLVMRDKTERPEALKAGTVKLVGADETRIFEEAARLPNDPKALRSMSRMVSPYGDGKAAGRILDLVGQSLA